MPELPQPVVHSFAELARAFAGDYSFLERRAGSPTPEQKRAWQPYVDGRIDRALTTYQGGASGGFLLDWELAKSVWDKARSDDGPLNQCLMYTTNKHSFRLPAFDETSRVNGSRWGGIQAYWQGQEDSNVLSNAGTPTSVGATKPKIGLVDFTMQRLMVYTEPMSRDLIDDSALVESMLTYAAHHEMRYAITAAMLTGAGTWNPQGIVGASCTVGVTRNTGSHIRYQDIDSMWSRMWPYCRRSSAWHCNDDVLNELDQQATAFNWPETVYLPEGAKANKWPLLKGRPVLVCEQLPALGAANGDLVLCDWSQYAIVASTAYAGVPSIEVSYGRPEVTVEGTMSEHLKFDTDSCVYKFKCRLDGRPMWRSAVTIANGTQTASAFVILNK